MGEYHTCFPGKEHCMRNEEGERSFEDHINFDKPYENIPHVMTSISSLDAGTQVRISIETFNITTTGFDVKISTWADTNFWFVKISWISFQ